MYYNNKKLALSISWVILGITVMMLSVIKYWTLPFIQAWAKS